MVRGTGIDLQTISVSTARTEVCMSTTHCLGRHDSSPFPWNIVTVTDPKLNGDVGKVSGVQSGFCFWSWDHHRWVSIPTLLSLGLHRVSQSSTWIPKFPGRHFYPWIDAKFLLLRGDYMQGTSYSAILLMSFPWPYFPLAQFEESQGKALIGLWKSHVHPQNNTVCSNWWH